MTISDGTKGGREREVPITSEGRFKLLCVPPRPRTAPVQ